MMGISVQKQRYPNSYSMILILYLLTRITKPISSFSLKDPNFNSSHFTLIDNAQISFSPTNNNNVVNFTSNTGPNSGQIIYNEPVQLSPITSFSTDFTFSLITPGHNNNQQEEGRFAFLVFPSGGPLSHQGYFGDSKTDLSSSNFVAVEYRVIHNDDDGNNNHVVEVFVSKLDVVMSNNVSLIGPGFGPGLGLGFKSWVDYEARWKRLEVRVGEADVRTKPVEPLLSFPIDLGEMWEGKDVLVGVSGRGRGEGEVSSLTDWSFDVRTVPSTLHSEPLDPSDHDHEAEGAGRRSKSRFLTVLGALIFGTGCGTLVAFVALLVWVVLFSRHSSGGGGGVNEMPMNQVDFKYEKVNVIVDNESHTTS